MKIQLLIAAAESDYAGYLSGTLCAKYAETFSVGLCSAQEKLSDVLSAKNYDVILIEPQWMPSVSRQSVKLVMALSSEESSPPERLPNVIQVQKYQRISALVSEILKHYGNVAPAVDNLRNSGKKIVAVWSPAGGVGKTVVALAFAARAASDGGTVTYLNFEHFSSADTCFARGKQGAGTLFEKLMSYSELSVKDIRQHDSDSGIGYFHPPDNYNDINDLTKDDMVYLTNMCVRASDVVVADLPGVCDRRVQAMLELADTVLLVVDDSKTAAAKLDVFVSQHVVYKDIKQKIRLVANKGSSLSDARFEKTIHLPRVQSEDPVSVYKTLSGNSFD
jgi:MinD-like ATPase involved in chromosome partitioning or flagellar assembly